mgnify:CR=1 FL=1
MSRGLSRAGAVAALVGGLGALAPALVLAEHPPSLAAAALSGACWWLAAQGPICLARVGWRAAGDRELGVSQCRHLAGTSVARQCTRRAGWAAGEVVRQVPAAATGAVAASLGAQVRVGQVVLVGSGGPGGPLLLAAVLGPLLGIALGTLAGLAAPTRRHLAVAAVAAVVATVTTFLLRPAAPGAEPWAVAMPLGGVWPVTPGWSLDRYLVLHVALHRRLVSGAAWSAVLALLALRSIRAGAARRSAPLADQP